jgi:hypothetical protein
MIRRKREGVTLTRDERHRARTLEHILAHEAMQVMRCHQYVGVYAWSLTELWVMRTDHIYPLGHNFVLN